MTATSRAIAALVEIMRDAEQAARRRIQSCEHLLGYEAPIEVIEEAKAVLMSIVEDSESVDTKLEALKLLRRVEACRVSPGRAVSGADLELARALEIGRRRRMLWEAGFIPHAVPGAFDDLEGPNYVPLTSPRPTEADLAVALRNARLARLASVRKNPDQNS